MDCVGKTDLPKFAHYDIRQQEYKVDSAHVGAIGNSNIWYPNTEYIATKHSSDTRQGIRLRKGKQV
jgi:hypothetical protein